MAETKTVNIIRQIYTPDTDKSVKLRKEKFLCYSKDRMKDLYPEKKKYRVIGETKAKNKKDEIGRIISGDKEFIVSACGENNKIFNYVAGYIKVGDDTYVQLLKSRFLFIILFFGLLCGIIAGTVILIGNLLGKPETPIIINPLPPEDSNAVVIGDEDSRGGDEDEEFGDGGESQGTGTAASTGGGSVSMIYTLSASCSLESGSVDIYFRNPDDSNHDVVIELDVLSGGEGVKIASSGRVSAGFGLYTLTLDPNVQISPGTYDARYKVYYYNPATGEKALVESVISDVVLTVS